VTTGAGSPTKMSLPENVAKLLDRILVENPLHRRFIQAALTHLTAEELDHFATYLRYCSAKGLDMEFMARCYLTIVEDTLREQIYFMANKEYRHKCFADVAGDVYFNEEYMNQYMYGLAITSFLWPNHVGLTRYFKETFPRNKRGNYLEIGPGHGYHIMTAMQIGKFDKYLGIDISKASIKQTRSIIDHFQPRLKSRFRLELTDFLEADKLEKHSFDSIVMGEVLEHVERPEKFLRRVAELAKSDAYIFITTCINAPAVDHIYLWRTANDLENMIRACGLSIKNSLYLTVEGKTIEEATAEAFAVNVAYVLGV